MNAHRHLVSAELVLTMTTVAEMFRERGDKNAANSLVHVAHHIATELGLSSASASFQLPTLSEQLTFFVQVFQATEQRNGSSEAVYSLLQANLNLLGEYFAAMWKTWAITMILDKNLEAAQGIAAVIGNFGVLINNFSLGNRAINLEIAIASYEINSTVFTRDAFPFEWANTQNNLGTVYCERIRGDRADNLQKAIDYLLAALEIRTREAFPEQWAETQNNLGNAYNERLQGERAENVELAIGSLLAALGVRTHQAYPQQWAETNNNLGNAYLDRIRGNRSENLEEAIHCYEAALKVYSCSFFPQQWADTQSNRGNAYLARIRGNRSENLEEAICSYKVALEVHTQSGFPERWAGIQNNLANAYLYRNKRNQGEDLEWVIHYCKNALKVYIRSAFPEQWALVHNNLGNAYLYRRQGKRAKNLQAAIRYYLAALEVRTRTAFIQDYTVTKFNLGLAYQADQQFSKAYDAFAGAIDAVEKFQRRDIIFGSGREEDKKKLAEQWNRLYQSMVDVCLKLGDRDRAIEYIERSKTRNLVELLANKNLYPQRDFYSKQHDHQKICEQLDQMRQEIATKQRELEIVARITDSESRKHEREQLQQKWHHLQQHRENLLADINKVDPSFKFTQQVETIAFSDIQSLIDDRSAIIEWYINDDKILTFIITRHSPQPEVIQSSAEDLSALLKRVSAYLRLYYRKDNKRWWRNQLESRLQNLAEILHIDEIISHIPAECDRLIIIPHRFLHLLPLHALPLGNKQLANGQKKQNCLLDKFSRGVGYDPSCQLLQLSQNQQRPNFSQLFAIQNPTGDLSYTNLEVETIGSFFAETQVLVKQEATKVALNYNNNFKLAHCCHFCCHGDFNLASPLESALILADNERLTLAEIFALSLHQCRLITLSACETGITDSTSISDEYISLPSGFLYAGSPSVVSSLWTVNDLSTALLMIKFYQNLHTNVSVAVSLNQAQLWLRDVTKIQLEDWITKHQLRLDLTLRMQLRRLSYQKPDGFQPFQSPFYWAAFCAIGN
ncbi:CHAT domain-containing protein [Nostoc sp. UIC 10890]